MANSHKATWNKTDYSKIGTKKMKPKRKTVLKNKIKRVGTQIFNYKDICHICGKLINVDINDVKYIINHEHGEKGLDVFGFIKDTTKEMLKRR